VETRKNRGFNRFNEPGPLSSCMGALSRATKVKARK